MNCDSSFCTSKCGFTCPCGVALCERAGCGGPSPACKCGKKMCGMCEEGRACTFCGTVSCETCSRGLFCERPGCSIYSCDDCGRVLECAGCSYICDGEGCGGELQACDVCGDFWCTPCATAKNTTLCARCGSFACAAGCADARQCEGCGDTLCGHCEPEESQPTCEACQDFWCSHCLDVGGRFTCTWSLCKGGGRSVCPTPDCAGPTHECADCGALASCNELAFCTACKESEGYCKFCAATALGACAACSEVRCIAICGKLKSCSGGCGARVCDELCERRHACPGRMG